MQTKKGLCSAELTDPSFIFHREFECCLAALIYLSYLEHFLWSFVCFFYPGNSSYAFGIGLKIWRIARAFSEEKKEVWAIKAEKTLIYLHSSGIGLLLLCGFPYNDIVAVMPFLVVGQ